MENIYTPKEAAAKLKVTEETIRQYLRQGRLKGFQLGGRKWRIKESSLLEFIDKAK